MSTTYVTRGTTMLFTVTFTDVTGANIVPAGANLRLSYMVNGTETAQTIPMTLNGNTYIATWVSDHPDPGTVFWHASSVSAQPSALDGQFVLRANDANPQSNT